MVIPALFNHFRIQFAKHTFIVFLTRTRRVEWTLEETPFCHLHHLQSSVDRCQPHRIRKQVHVVAASKTAFENGHLVAFHRALQGVITILRPMSDTVFDERQITGLGALIDIVL
jgi:hypothetical protein